ncbi:DUF4097 family beta strand repeat-containing protein [Pedobacter nutrimenti]|nr:DUF4097 family beta strand repeat-containing protein [Pedobacter nutrimenti]
MKMLKIGISVLLLVVSSLISQGQTGAKDQLNVPLTEPGKPYRLEVSLLRGSITIVGYEGKEIIVNVRTEEEENKRAKESENPAGMKRYTLDNKADVTAEVNNNVVKVRSRLPNQLHHLTLKVPLTELSLKLKAVNNGDITVSNVNGNIEATNVNGAIQINKVAGSVVANTINGNIVVSFRSIDPKASMAFSTLNGHVDVSFPENLKANLKLKSDRGEIYSDFNIVAEAGKLTTEQNQKKGLFRIHLNDWLNGKVNGGGPEMLMKNMNGNIYVRKTK